VRRDQSPTASPDGSANIANVPTALGIGIDLPAATPWLAVPRFPGAADGAWTATVAVCGEFSKIVVPSTLATMNQR